MSIKQFIYKLINIDMKQNYLLSGLFLMSLLFSPRVFAGEPAIMLNFKMEDTDFKKVTCEIKYEGDNEFTLKVDPGNGEIIDMSFNNRDCEFDITVVPPGNVRIYGDIQSITSFHLQNTLQSNISLSSVDVSGLTELTSLRIDYPVRAESVILGANHKLEDISVTGVKSINTEEAGNLRSLELSAASFALLDLNRLSQLKNLRLIDCTLLYGIDISGCRALTDLSLCHTWLSDIDLSHNEAIENIDLSFCELNDIDLSHNPNIRTLNLSSHISVGISQIDLSLQTELEELNISHNSLSWLDLSSNTKLKHAVLSSNKLEHINIENLTGLEELDLSGNKFTYSTLPQGSEIESYFYGNQAPYEVVPEGNKVDLSLLYKVDTFMPGDDSSSYTEFVWYNDRSGKIYKEGEDYISEEGVFIFNEPLQGIYCEMTNGRFPGLQLRTNVISLSGVDSTLSDGVYVKGGSGEIHIEGAIGNVEVFNSSGIKIGENKDVFKCPSGIYIVRVSNRIYKVIVR